MEGVKLVKLTTLVKLIIIYDGIVYRETFYFAHRFSFYVTYLVFKCTKEKKYDKKKISYDAKFWRFRWPWRLTCICSVCIGSNVFSDFYASVKIG